MECMHKECKSEIVSQMHKNGCDTTILSGLRLCSCANIVDSALFCFVYILCIIIPINFIRKWWLSFRFKLHLVISIELHAKQHAFPIQHASLLRHSTFFWYSRNTTNDLWHRINSVYKCLRRDVYDFMHLYDYEHEQEFKLRRKEIKFRVNNALTNVFLIRPVLNFRLHAEFLFQNKRRQQIFETKIWLWNDLIWGNMRNKMEWHRIQITEMKMGLEHFLCSKKIWDYKSILFPVLFSNLHFI